MSYRHSAAAMNVALSHDAQVNALGVKTSWQNGLWRREPGRLPPYLTGIILDPDAVGLLGEIESLTLAARGTAVTLWDLWSTVDLQSLGYERTYTEHWYWRHAGATAPKPRRVVTRIRDADGLRQFVTAWAQGFEVPAGRTPDEPFRLYAVSTLQDERSHYLGIWDDRELRSSAIGFISDDVTGIYGISTVPEYRRRGFATDLVRHILTIAPELPAVVQPDPLSVPIYVNLGFEVAGLQTTWRKAP